MGSGKKPTFLSREDVLRAIRMSKSSHGCARYLRVDYHTFRKYAKLYKTDDGTQTLHEISKNPSGKGIPKFLKDGKNKFDLLDIIEGRTAASSFDPKKIKHRLIEEGYIEEKCAVCGFNERRVIDYKMPLLLHHKNGNKLDFKLENIELLCMNCFFLRVADPLTAKDLEQIDSPVRVNQTTEAINWELDDYHLQRLKELGLMDDEKDDDPNEFISRI